MTNILEPSSFKANYNECDICYENCSSLIKLSCCNSSKSICIDCVSCLKTYICPYCRQELPDEVAFMIFQRNKLRVQEYSTSLPADIFRGNVGSWEYFIENEYLIDPTLACYSHDSKVLRRKIRELRKVFMHKKGMCDISDMTRNSRYKQSRRRRRHSIRKFTNKIMDGVNANTISVDLNNQDLIFDMDGI